MSKSADQLEHEVEVIRGKLESTLADLSSRLNSASLSEELVGTRGPVSAINLTGERLAHAARLNPVPVLLICVGVTYLVYDAGRRAAERCLGVTSKVAQRRASDGRLISRHPD